MKLYPAFLDLTGRACLVAGAGRVGAGRAADLADAGASVLVVDPAPCDPVLELARTLDRVVVERRAFRDADCDGRLLVFACTNDASVNEQVVRACERAGSLCCRADDAPRGHFQVPAVLRRGDFAVAVSSGGASPALALEARDRIECVVGEEFGEAARLLGDLRIRLRERGRSLAAVDRAFVRSLVSALASGGAGKAAALVEDVARTSGLGSHSEVRCTR